VRRLMRGGMEGGGGGKTTGIGDVQGRARIEEASDIPSNPTGQGELQVNSRCRPNLENFPPHVFLVEDIE